MSLKRIVTVVVLVVVALVAAYCILDWASVGEVSAYVKNGIDASLDAHLHPEEWQLGDVHVVKDDNEAWEAVSYTARLNEDVLRLASGINEQGEAFETGFVLGGSAERAGIIPSKLKLDQSRLPEEAAEAAARAQAIASAMRKQKPWPWSLRDISGRVKDLSEGRMRLETQPAGPTFVYTTTWLYGSDRVFELLVGSSFAKLYLWKDRMVVYRSSKRLALELTEHSLTVYTGDEREARDFIDGLGRNLASAIFVFRASPDAPPGVLGLLVQAQQWLATGKLKTQPALDDERLGKLTEPWELPHSSGPIEGGLEFANAPKTAPVEIAGVTVADDRHGQLLTSLLLTRDGFAYEWYPRHGSWLKPVDGYPGLYITVAEDSPYASTTAEFAEDEVNQPVVALRSMAHDMLAVPVENWPERPWRDRLHVSLSALDAGRFYARSVAGNVGLESRMVFEGDEAWAVFPQEVFSRELAVGILELGLTENGFALRDTYSGCLLEVKGGAMTLTQTREAADAGLSLHLPEAAALAEWASTSADKLPPDLVASLTQAREFLTNPSLPSATLVDSMEVPDWSLEKIRERMPARKSKSSG